MKLLESLSKIWQGIDYYFLIFNETEFKFYEIEYQQVDL